MSCGCAAICAVTLCLTESSHRFFEAAPLNALYKEICYERGMTSAKNMLTSAPVIL